jgi:hypothetical protein
LSATYEHLGIQVPTILLPHSGLDLQRWSVIACDQFTSEPEYWQQVAGLVGDAPSTLHLILPEAYLGTPEEQERTQKAQQAMVSYHEQNLLTAHAGMVLVRRQVSGRTRHGLMLALDLERYDFSKGSQSLIRATEGTIIERLPPRMKIRSGAALEIPHILVLIDDPGRTVIEPLVGQSENLHRLYDFDLMMGSGHLTGFSAADPASERQVVAALAKLADPDYFASRYGVGSQHGVLLFAMGDGNHSLATAKSFWEQTKAKAGMHHPARYALVEVENIHDPGLEFEPIHRVLFGVKADLHQALGAEFGSRAAFQPLPGAEEMTRLVASQPGGLQSVGLVSPEGCGLITFHEPSASLAVGTLQSFLDKWLASGGAESVDYVHGAEVTVRLGSQPGNLGFYLPAMAKSDLFRTVILDGALPRKTFSMGEAHEKRFYMECRQIAD